MTSIHPIHFSLNGKTRLPNKMDRIQLPPGMKEDITEIAISIFADCVNVAVPFQDALLAVYLSGLQHGQEMAKEIT